MLKIEGIMNADSKALTIAGTRRSSNTKAVEIEKPAPRLTI
jgi:hypothetical protein